MTIEENEKIIKKNIQTTIARLKKSGVTSMGLENLRQITPSNGVDVAVALYPDLFASTAKKYFPKFLSRS